MIALVHSRAWLLLGWSMIHFLWLGAAVLVAAGILRLLLRRAPPNARYTLAVATLMILVASPALVAIRLAPRSLIDTESMSLEVSSAPVNLAYQPPLATSDANRRVSPQQSVAARPSDPALDVAAIEAMARRVGRIGAAYLPWLWLAGFPVTVIYLLAGISGTGRLQRRARLATEPALLAMLDRLAAELGVRGRVVIGLSAQVVVPLVVGISRPMILLPAVLLAGWSPEELELILLHELAHVRRLDNLVNLFQRIAEAVLFFHPAVWIVSRWVRLEREQCCDEIVLRHRDTPQKYAETLAALAVPGISPVHAAAAMANHQLVARIRNILNVEDRTMRFSARNLLVAAGSVALLAGLLFIAGPLAADDQPPTTASSSSPDNVKAPKSAEKQERVLVNVDLDGREVGTQRNELLVVKDTSGSLAANGQKRSWGPEQACGAPDTLQPGDFATAWASATPDGQREWLEVDFGEQIDGIALVVYENNAPGAVDKLVLLDGGANVIEVRGVKDPTPTSAPSGVSIFPLVGSMHGVRVEIDSSNVPGWNEIDAVGLLDKQGQVHWAKTAKASSTFADVARRDLVQVGQPFAYFAGDAVRFRPMTFTATVAVDQDFANDPEIARLRKSVEEIDQGLRGIAIEGDAAQQELAKKRVRRAELRKHLLNEEIEDRAEQIRRDRAAEDSEYQRQAEKAKSERLVAADQARAAEEAARANAAKAEADRAQAETQLKAAADANRKLQDELAILQHRDADERVRKAVTAHTDCATCHSQPHEAADRDTLKEQAIVTAKKSLGIIAKKLGTELKGLDRQAQSASNTGRAQIAERMQKLHYQLDAIQRTVRQLDNSLHDEAVRKSYRQDLLQTQPATPVREDRAGLEAIERLDKAVEELLRAQQDKPDPLLPRGPWTPQSFESR